MGAAAARTASVMPANTAIVITHEVIDFIPTLLGVGIKGQKSITAAKKPHFQYGFVGFALDRGRIVATTTPTGPAARHPPYGV